MARLARHQICPECPPAPPLYHVTNRGVDRRDLFDEPRDYLVFLSILALVCIEDGLRVHAYCLMSNHFHLLIEDPRGMLSRAMLRLTSSYARYRNDSRGRRGSGHVFGDRFHCELVDSALYYDQVTSYILLNPLRCQPPLAADPVAYRWSSAALHERGSAEAFSRELVDAFGGIDGVLAAMPTPSHRSVTLNRRARLAALCSGVWIDAVAARCGRSVTEMRQVLSERERSDLSAAEPSEPRAGAAKPQRASGPGGAAGQANRRYRSTVPLPLADAPRVTERFAGWTLADVAEAIHTALRRWMPAGHAAEADVHCALLWRFTSVSLGEISALLAIGEAVVEEAVRRVRGQRRTETAWERQLRALEWQTRWLVRSGPVRA